MPRYISIRFRRERLTNPGIRNASPGIAIDAASSPPKYELLAVIRPFSALLFAVVLMLSATDPGCVMLAGVNVHAVLAGRPEQAKVIAGLNVAPVGVESITRLELAGLPAVTVAVVVLVASNEKSVAVGGVPVPVSVTVIVGVVASLVVTVMVAGNDPADGGLNCTPNWQVAPAARLDRHPLDIDPVS
jgi:hypothetical protein